MEGLKPKLDGLQFLGLIQEYDVSILIDLWKADNSKINIEGFWDYSQIRPKHKIVTTHSCGIKILAKHNIQTGIKLVEN